MTIQDGNNMVSTGAFITRPVCQRKGHLPMVEITVLGDDVRRWMCPRCNEETTEEGELI